MAMDVEEIAADVWQVRTRWANAFLMRRNSVVTIVDSGSPRSLPLVLRSARRVLGPAAKIGVIAMTHCHVDHTANLAELLTLTKAGVYLPPDDAPHIEQGKPCPGSVWCRLGAWVLGLSSAKRLPGDRAVLNTEQLMSLSGLEAIPTPGHTPGHTSFWHDTDRVLFAGDTAEAGEGAIARRRLPCHVNLAQADASAQLLATRAPAVVGFGHGDPLILG